MKKILTWLAFIIVLVLIVWGLVAAQKKAASKHAALVLPNQIVAIDHIRGNPNAPVVMVEYGDFQCPACGLYHPLVEEVLALKGLGSTTPANQQASSSVAFIFRHFPLTQHPNAMPAAQASEAASIQGKFWEMHDKLYETQKDWENSKDPKTIFVGYAKDLGLNSEKFATDYELPALKDIINNNYEGGVAAKINSTPTFFVNGKTIINPQSIDAFKKLLDDAASTTTQ